MAAAAVIPRPRVTREEVESLAGEVASGGSLGLKQLWLPLDAMEDEEGKTVVASCYVLMVRSGGFMVVVPSLDRVQEALSFSAEESDCTVLFHPVQISLMTTRGRALGEADALLVDLPWQMVSEFVRHTAPRGAYARLFLILGFSVGATLGKPVAESCLEAAQCWIAGDLDADTAQDYATAEEFDAEEEAEQPGEEVQDPHAGDPSGVSVLQEQIRQLQEEVARLRQPATPAAKPATAHVGATPKAQARATDLFGGARNQLSAEDWNKLQRMAGGPPGRLGGAEKKRGIPALPVAAITDTGFAELEKEATDGMDLLGANMAGIDLSAMDPMQRMLYAQMQQNAFLVQKLTTPKGSQDMMSLLAGGGGSDQGSSSSGAKGCVAREVFLRNAQDLPKVATITRYHAMKELGISPDKEDGSLMKKYIERRVPLANHRLLAHVAQLTAEGWAIAHESSNEEMLGFLSRMMYFVEQVALDNGRIDLGWLLTGFTEPNAHLHFPLSKVPGLKPFCRLTHPLWVSANLAYLKNFDFLEGRVASLGKPKPRSQVLEDDPDVTRLPKPKPKKKPKGGGRGGVEDPSQAGK